MRCAAAVCLLLLPAPEEDLRQAALERVSALAERFSRFENAELSVSALSRLGRIVCKYDEPAARVILRQAAAALKASELEIEQYDGLRGIVLHRAAACDAELIEPIREITEPDANDPARSAGATLEAARALLKTDPGRAAAIAAPAIEAAPSMNRDQSWELPDFLFELGQQDDSLSDRLFQDALARFRESPGGNWDSLQSLGNYVFGPPGEERSSSSTELDGVEVYDWRARRPQASDESVRLYVRTLAEALSAPADSNENEWLRSMMARQIAQFAQALAPQLVPVLEEAHLPAEVERGLSELFPGRTFDEYLAQAAQSENPRVRIQAKVRRFRLLWEAGKFAEAAVAASEVKDVGLRANLYEFIDCGRAARAIQDEELELAYVLAAEVTDSDYQALLHLGLASAHLRNGEMEASRRSITLASHAAAQAHPAFRPQLLLATAAMQAKAEPESAFSTLVEALRLYNQEAEAQSSGWRRRSLHLRAIPGGFIVPLGDGNGMFYASAFFRVKGLGGFDVASVLRLFADF
ncbi:MAG: hypothetical protein GY953_21345, partial [bacterium]|nr:hypothetical protein [bacterium]